MRENFRKTNNSHPPIRTRTYAYQGVKNVRFSENFACEMTERNDFYSLYYFSSIHCSFITRISFLLTRFFIRKNRFFLELRNCSRPYSNCNCDEIFQMKHFHSRLEEQAVYNNYFQQRKYGFKSYQDAYLEPSQTFTLWSFFENSYQLKSVNTVAKKFHRRCSTGF